jgi:hypothetical protein
MSRPTEEGCGACHRFQEPFCVTSRLPHPLRIRNLQAHRWTIKSEVSGNAWASRHKPELICHISAIIFSETAPSENPGGGWEWRISGKD